MASVLIVSFQGHKHDVQIKGQVLEGSSQSDPRAGWKSNKINETQTPEGVMENEIPIKIKKKNDKDGCERAGIYRH